MNPDTGAIAHFETEEDARLAGFTESLTAEQAGELAGMNRQQRRAWLAQNRKEIQTKAALDKHVDDQKAALLDELKKRADEGSLTADDFEKNA